MPALPEAVLWDVDGTLAETELQGHRRAFNRAFAEAGLPYRWDPSLYLQLLAISGGRERLRHFLTQVHGASPSSDQVEALQASKTRHYTALVAAGELQLRPGVRRLMAELAAAGVVQALVTTSGRRAVQALLEGNGMAPQRAAELAHTLASGQWTHDYPISVEEAAALGLPVTVGLPMEVYKLMELYPQPSQRAPSVQYIPVPYPDRGQPPRSNGR